jgi:hypothetical protein
MKRSLIAFIGLRRSGKDTAAQALANSGYELVKFADALKGMLRCYLAYVGVNPDTIERMIEGDLKEEPTQIFAGRSCRWAMQTLGTEWGRDLIGSDLWVNATMARASQFGLVVISDCRFPNEAAAVKAQGGTIIRIHREGLTADSHPSEQLIESIPDDFTINNDGTVADLQQSVLNLVELHNL